MVEGPVPHGLLEEGHVGEPVRLRDLREDAFRVQQALLGFRSSLEPTKRRAVALSVDQHSARHLQHLALDLGIKLEERVLAAWPQTDLQTVVERVGPDRQVHPDGTLPAAARPQSRGQPAFGGK
jgi:hypothetical protein